MAVELSSQTATSEWELVLNDYSTIPLKVQEHEEYIETTGQSDQYQVLSIAERYEQMIDLGAYHVRRLEAELEEKERRVQYLEAENHRLRIQAVAGRTQ
ncbi:hypothetical protein AAF712_003960 [Marasmius tenuissimus]|uniref:Uncharacterized protein n=1 Tax=Marasmius tenuissimus TaxID=585030 RepID=A0ABR3A8V6_9AGAR